MPLEYSDRARIGYAELYKPVNERTIFIEDAAGRLIYERLFEKMLGSGRVKRVFALSGRELVLADWRKNKGRYGYLYIIDGDLDLWFADAVEIDNLFQHDRYAIENYLFSEAILSDIIQDYDNGKNSTEDIENSFRNKIEEIEKQFSALFLLYAISHFVKTGERTVKDGAMRFCKPLIPFSQVVTISGVPA